MAEFGAGFRVLEYRLDSQTHHARIGHLGNEYLVASDNLRAWTLLASSIR